MKNTRILRRTRRAGLTLIELIVVLTILIALGGIAATVAPDLLGTAHVAEHATNNATVEQAVQINRFTSTGNIGDRFDSLTDGAALYDRLGATGVFTAYTLTGDDADALQAVGVNTVFNGTNGGDNATFAYHPDYLPTNAVAPTAIAALDATNADFAAILARFNVQPDANSEYLVMGVGPGCTLVGANGAIAEAPVHFADDAAARPDQVYARYCVLVELQDAGGTDNAARFLGVGVIHSGEGLVRGGQAMAEFYE